MHVVEVPKKTSADAGQIGIQNQTLLGCRCNSELNGLIIRRILLHRNLALGIRELSPFYELIKRCVVRDARFKRRLIEQAWIQTGYQVLDVGSWTGRLAMLVKRADPNAEVVGWGADAQMLKLASAKAIRETLDTRFDRGMAFSLPHADASSNG